MLLLTGCGGITKEEFFQDEQNMEKSIELNNKAIEFGCDKLATLNKFTRSKKPNSHDLSKIMPILGLREIDATDIDKMYTLDLSNIKNYTCTNIRDEKIRYCREKYSNAFDVFKENQCLASVYDKIPPFSSYDLYDNSINFVYDGKDLYDDLGNKIRQVYDIPDEVKYLLPEFTASELIKADNEILGAYDEYCGWPLCSDDDLQNVTKLNAAMVLHDFCNQEHWQKTKECICYAHETYKKVDYKNVIYIYEQHDIPKSKRAEFDKIFTQCEQKIERERKKKEQNRYGESTSASESDEAFGQFFIETLENAAWAHKTITDTRKKAEQRSKNK